MTAIYLGLSWIAGVFLGSLTGLWVVMAFSAAGGAFACAFLWRHKTATSILLLCLAAVLGGALRLQSVPVGDELQQLRGPARVNALLVADPEPGDRTTALYLEAVEVEQNGQRRAVSGGLLAYASRFASLGSDREFPYYHYGDLLSFEGSLETPSDSESFAYGEYLGRRGIHSIMRYPQKVELISTGQGFPPMDWLYQARNSLSSSLEKALPQPQNSLAQGILLGKRGSIPDALQDDLSATSTWHIVAISGQNLSIIAGIMVSVAAWVFGRRRITYLLITLALIWSYTALTGMSASVVRAALMVSLWLAAQRIGRPNSAATSLVLAASVILAFSPQSIWDVGFQLSFAAMSGLIFLAPRFQSWGQTAIDDRNGWQWSLASVTLDAISVTLAATIFTLPIIAYNFGSMTLVGLPATLLALPALPGIIVTSAVTAFAGLLHPMAGQILGWLTWLPLTYLMKIIEVFASMPMASVSTGRFAVEMVWAFYAGLASVLWITSSSRPSFKVSGLGDAGLTAKAARVPKRYILLPMLLIAVVLWSVALTWPDGRLRVSFLDVGQGDSALIEVQGKAILIDGGPSPEALRLQLGKQLPFWKHNIDLVILSHPDADHVAGLAEVARVYEIDSVLEGGTPGTDSSAAYREWRRIIQQQGIPLFQATYGQRIELGQGAWLEVLGPDLSQPVNPGIDPDNYSAVVRLVEGKVSFLFTGDMRSEAEQMLIVSGLEPASTVLKISHHGSATSSSSAFLAEVDPEVAVISAGAANRFGHPSPTVMARLSSIEVYRTDTQGTIEFTTDGERLWVKAYGAK